MLHPHVHLISYSRPPYSIYIYPDIIFQILLLCSRPMMSQHVTCNVTVMSYAFFIIQKKKEKKQKQNYKIRKIKENKNC